jgi:Flp pilus assembly protein TadG
MIAHRKFRRRGLVVGRVIKQRASRRGIATVELALLSPFLLVIVIAVCELGQTLKVEAIISQAARKACAVATRPASSNSDVIADAQALINASGLPGSAAIVKILVNGQERNVATAVRGDTIAVSISIPHAAVTSTRTSVFMVEGSIQSESAVMIKQ